MKKNMLTRINARKVEDFLLANWDRILADRPRLNALALEVTQTLQFPVYKSNLAGAARVLGKEFPAPARAKRVRGGAGTEVVGRMSGTGIARWRMVCDAVLGLYVALGEPNPANMQAFRDSLGEAQVSAEQPK